MKRNPKTAVRFWLIFLLALPLGVGFAIICASHFRRDAGLREEIERLRASVEVLEARVPEPTTVPAEPIYQIGDTRRMEELRGENNHLRVQLGDLTTGFFRQSNFMAARITELEKESAGSANLIINGWQRYRAEQEKNQSLQEDLAHLNRQYSGKPTVPRIGAWMGVTIASASGLDAATPNGVVIRDLVERGPANFAGLQVGDVVVSIDGRAVSTTEDFKGILSQMAGEQLVSVDVQRTNWVFKIPVRVNDWPQ